MWKFDVEGVLSENFLSPFSRALLARRTERSEESQDGVAGAELEAPRSRAHETKVLNLIHYVCAPCVNINI
jgi:hypothetical protein